MRFCQARHQPEADVVTVLFVLTPGVAEAGDKPDWEMGHGWDAWLQAGGKRKRGRVGDNDGRALDAPERYYFLPPLSSFFSSFFSPPAAAA
jgi:hypothetical protein